MDIIHINELFRKAHHSNIDGSVLGPSRELNFSWDHGGGPDDCIYQESYNIM